MSATEPIAEDQAEVAAERLPPNRSLLRTLLARALWIVPTILLVSFGVFALIDLAPGDIATSIAGENASAEQVQDVRERLELDKPILDRYWDWLYDAAQGDLGSSLLTDEPVTDIIARTFPTTLSLTVVAMTMSGLIALVAGSLAASRPGGLIDRAVSVGAAAGIAVPSFLLGVILVSQLAVKRDIFPALGYVSITDDFGQWLWHLILPAIALAGVTAGELARQLRGALRDVLEQDFVLAGHAKGLGRFEVLIRHAMRNAAIPVVTVFGVRFSQILGGTVIVEEIFLLRGMGSSLVAAVLERNLPIVLGIAVVTTVIVVVVNFAIDVSYAFLNPKIRHS